MATTAAVSPPKQSRWSNTLKNFWLDIALFIAFVVDYNLNFTGLAIHEWLGIGLGFALIYHLLWHWDWIVQVSKRIVSKLPIRQRLKYLVDLLFFIDMVLLIVTGLWISKVALPQIGIQTEMNGFFRWLHVQTADWAIWLLAIHVALSWEWLVKGWQRYIWRPLMGRNPSEVDAESEGAA